MSERKAFPFEITELKAATGNGWEISGYASTFGGQPDSYGDVVAAGAFLKSLQVRKPKFFYQHEEPIGATLDIGENEKGLYGTWSIVDTVVGTDAHKLAKAGAIDSLSIGYMTKQAEFREDGVRVIQEADLFEVSLVAIPANENALVTSVKADVPFDVLLKRIGLSLKTGADEAEALLARRAADGRELTERHIEALKESLAQAEAYAERVRGLTVPMESTTGYRPSIALVELRLRRLGIHIERDN